MWQRGFLPPVAEVGDPNGGFDFTFRGYYLGAMPLTALPPTSKEAEVEFSLGFGMHVDPRVLQETEVEFSVALGVEVEPVTVVIAEVEFAMGMGIIAEPQMPIEIEFSIGLGLDIEQETPVAVEVEFALGVGVEADVLATVIAEVEFSTRIGFQERSIGPGSGFVSDEAARSLLDRLREGDRFPVLFAWAGYDGLAGIARVQSRRIDSERGVHELTVQAEISDDPGHVAARRRGETPVTRVAERGSLSREVQRQAREQKRIERTLRRDR